MLNTVAHETLGALTLNSGTFDLNGGIITVSSFSGSGGTIQDGELDVNVAADTIDTFAGTLSVDLVKTGPGQLFLTGSNANFVNNGSNGTIDGFPEGDLYVDSGNTLGFGGTFTNYGVLTIEGGIGVGGTLINDGGLINVNNTLLIDGTVENIDGGNIEVHGDCDLYMGNITNSATINVLNTMTIEYGELDSSGVINIVGTLESGGVINNSGSIVVASGGTLTVDSAAGHLRTPATWKSAATATWKTTERS